MPFPRVLGFVETAAVRHSGEFIFAPMLWIIREQEHDVIEPLVQGGTFLIAGQNSIS